MESRGEENERGDHARKLSTGKWDSRKKRKNLKRGNDHKNLPEMKDVRESTQIEAYRRKGDHQAEELWAL